MPVHFQRFLVCVFSLLVIVVAGDSLVWGASYYIDCRNGSDRSTGDSPAEAWKSLEKVNETIFAAGDQILFKRGEACDGMLRPRGSGAEGAPILIGAYGEGSLPLIRAGENEAALKLFNQEFWEIENLETSGGSLYGICISGNRSGVLRHFRVRNVVVHDVGGEVETKDSGLIVVFAVSPSLVLEDIVIDGVTAYGTTQWSGIIVDGGSEEVRAENVIIRNSIVYDVYGDGIVLYEVEKGRIEKSAAWLVGLQPRKTVGTPNGIWTWRCRDCVVEYTEGFLVDSPGVDGGVYDIDWGNENNIVQYNYGHDAMGYCIAIFGSNVTTSHSIVRYNVCVNNGRSPKLAKRQGDLYLSTWNEGALDGVQIYNNTFYWNPPMDVPAVRATGAQFSGVRENLFANNLFYSSVPTLVDSDSPWKEEANLYWHEGSREPVFVLNGTIHEGCDEAKGDDAISTSSICRNPGLDSTLRLLPESPALDSGSRVQGAGDQDAFGRPIPSGNGIDIGAVEMQEADEDRDVEGRRGTLPEPIGDWLLFSYLDPSSPDSRSQVVFLQSALYQFASRGLEVAVSAAPEYAGETNWQYDWNLGDIRVIPPTDIPPETWPTTALISPEGRLVRWWKGFVTPAEIGLTLRANLGPPQGGLPVELPSPE